MKTSKLILLITVICLLFNGCVAVAESPVPVKTEQPEFTAAENTPENTNTPTVSMETATPTPAPTITRTPLPTIDKHPPTPTVERPVEWDIDPYIEYEVEGEYKGVKIKGSVIIDRSLEPLVEGIYVNKNLFSEMIAKLLAYVWYSRHGDYRGIHYSFQYEWVTSDEMDRWFGLWAKAQETGSEYYWRQVQLDNIWANDLNDGDGYMQKPYVFWPMYDGPTPWGVKAIDTITIVLFDASKSGIRNVTAIAERAADSVVLASNLDNNNLIIYTGKDISANAKRIEVESLYSQKLATKLSLQGTLYCLFEYLIFNDGVTDFSTYPIHFVVPYDIARLIGRAVEYRLNIE